MLNETVIEHSGVLDLEVVGTKGSSRQAKKTITICGYITSINLHKNVLSIYKSEFTAKTNVHMNFIVH